MRAPQLLRDDCRAGRFRFHTKPDGTERLPTAANQGGFRLADKRASRKCRRGLGLPHVHADPTADHGDVGMATSGSGAAFQAAIAVRGVDRAILDSGSLGGSVADADGPEVARPNDHVDAHEHLVHADVWLGLIDGGLRARFPATRKWTTYFGLSGIRESPATRCKDNPRPGRTPPRADQRAGIVPCSSAAFRLDETVGTARSSACRRSDTLQAERNRPSDGPAQRRWRVPFLGRIAFSLWVRGKRSCCDVDKPRAARIDCRVQSDLRRSSASQMREPPSPANSRETAR